MAFPNFFIIGASKSGTTSLYYYLKQHPEIYMSNRKEPSFFHYRNKTQSIMQGKEALFSSEYINRMSKTDLNNQSKQYYSSLFDGVEKEKVIGEASTIYLPDPHVPAQIYKEVPDSKLLCILRNPFDAIYSHFLMEKRRKMFKEGITFMQVLKAENNSDPQVLLLPNLIRLRFYDEQISRYLNFFRKDQLFIAMYEDLKHPIDLTRNIFQFLDVSDSFKPDFSLAYNAAPQHPYQFHVRRLLQLFAGQMPPAIRNNLSNFLPASIFHQYMKYRISARTQISQHTTSKCPEEAKHYLRPIFTPHILNLQEIIKRDLLEWLE